MSDTNDIHDHAEASRYEIVDGGELAGIAEYRRRDHAIAFTHTETRPGHEGKGVARRLVEFALADARRQGLAVLPYCPYVRKVIADHPDQYLDLVPVEARGEFDLPTPAAPS
jgi:predicted GNAT family acetyltransferase